MRHLRGVGEKSAKSATTRSKPAARIIQRPATSLPGCGTQMRLELHAPISTAADHPTVGKPTRATLWSTLAAATTPSNPCREPLRQDTSPRGIPCGPSISDHGAASPSVLSAGSYESPVTASDKAEVAAAADAEGCPTGEVPTDEPAPSEAVRRCRDAPSNTVIRCRKNAIVSARDIPSTASHIVVSTCDDVIACTFSTPPLQTFSRCSY